MDGGWARSNPMSIVTGLLSRHGLACSTVTADAPNEVSAVLARVDLNLLLTLDTLLRERSVTRSAPSLGLGQPAISASLARLRRYFADDLLVRPDESGPDDEGSTT